MAGLLDFLNTPEGQGLLAAGFGGLAGARQGQPFNSIGRAGLAGLSGYAAAQDQQGQMADRTFKVQQQARQTQEWAKSDKIDALAGQYYTAAAPGIGSTEMVNDTLPADLRMGAQPALSSAKPAAFDAQGYTNALMGIDPVKGVAFAQAQAKDSMFGKVDPKDYTPQSVQKFALTRSFGDLVPRSKAEVAPNGQVFDPYSIQPGQFLSDPNKPMTMTAQGPVANLPFQRYELTKAKAGASNTNNTISVAGPENKYNADVGAGLAKDGLDLVSAAKAAPETVRNAQAIRSALDSGAITGTGAETRFKLQKALETTGLVGKGQAASTEELMAGLSKLTLSGIKTSGLGGGQGFTDKDREFLNAAVSGSIESTPANLRRVADLSERQAQATHAKGKTVLQRWQKDPALRNIAQDTQMDEVAPSTPAAATGAPFDFKAAASAELARRKAMK